MRPNGTLNTLITRDLNSMTLFIIGKTEGDSDKNHEIILFSPAIGLSDFAPKGGFRRQLSASLKNPPHRNQWLRTREAEWLDALA